MISLAAFLPALANPKVWAWLSGIALAGFLSVQVFSFVNQALDDRDTVIRQELDLQLKKNQIETLTLRMQLAEEAQKISEAARLEAEERERILSDIRDQALSAGDDQDGPLAPVLQNTLRALRSGD